MKSLEDPAPASVSPAVETPPPVVAWPAPARVAFRVLFVYLLLYTFRWSAALLPGLGDWLERGYVGVWNNLVPWVGAHVLHLRAPVSEPAPNGSGDTTFAYVQVLCFVGVALAAAGLWSLAGARRKEHRALLAALRICVRFLLAGAMLSYGMSKVLGIQFPTPSPLRLMESYGDSSPMGLLWTFMGASRAYSVCAGAAEVAGGALLFFRRTTPLGALVIAAVMTNVVLLNLCYDVPVKLYSLHLLGMAVFLLAPDLRALAKVLLPGRAAPPASPAPPAAGPFSTPFWTRRRVIAARVSGVLIAGMIVFQSAAGPFFYARRQHRQGPPGPLPAGVYEVTRFVKDGQVIPPLLTEDSRWRLVGVGDGGRLRVRRMDDSLGRFQLEGAPGADLRDIEQGPHFTLATSSLSEQAGEMIQLSGLVDGVTIEVSLRRRPDAGWLLLDRGFHWVNEFPFNR
jgi:uncharacterized membrane protein YphA (DoxX/SURF4 family)